VPGDNWLMFPMRMSTIFKNRWWALVWAAGIIWFAYDFAGSAPQGDTNNVTADNAGAPVSSDNANKASELLGN
jgi:hypothetical protein